MAAVPGYDYDMFVSYAHLDNQPPAAGIAGWVELLVEKLQLEVRQRGIRQFEALSDEKLAENFPLTPQLLSKIGRSATLLVVMSPAYLQSDWCRREREAFLNLVHDRIAEGSVFVVEVREVNHSEYPKEFADLVPVSFWLKDPESKTDRPLGVPNPDEEKYYKRLLRLSYLIKCQMEHLVAKQSRPQDKEISPVAVGPSVTVYVARSTEDLEDREEELRSYLGQYGITVLPQTRYPQTDAAAFEGAMQSDLSLSKLYVQLLSGSRGRELDFPPFKRHPCFQHEVAQRLEKPKFLWRDRSLELSSIRDPEYLKLVESARTSAFEEFKRAVADEALKPQAQSPDPPPYVMVFVNADHRDRELARQIGRELKQNGVECLYPLESGTPEEIRRDLEDTIRECDGILFIYGRIGADWVRYQWRQGRKALSQRKTPLKALAVFEGPPPDKTDIAVDIPNLITLNCRDGVSALVLNEFVRSLQR